MDDFERARHTWGSERASRLAKGEKALSRHPGLTESIVNGYREGAADYFHPLTLMEIVQILAKDEEAREAVKSYAGVPHSMWSDDPQGLRALNARIAWGLVDYLAKQSAG